MSRPARPSIPAAWPLLVDADGRPWRRGAGLALMAVFVALVHGWMLARWPGGPHRGTSSSHERRAPVQAVIRVPMAPVMPLAAAAPPSPPADPVIPAATDPAPAPTPQPPPTALAGTTPANAGANPRQPAPPMAQAEDTRADTAAPDPSADEPGPPGDSAGSGPAQPPPVYPTRPPDPVRLHYRLQLPNRNVPAQLTWAHEADQYRMRLEALGPQLQPVLVQTSQGGFDAAGLAPERFVDRRGARGARAANFQRDIGRITFSGPRIEHPAWPGAQDRLSWMAQLAAICAAAGAMPPQVSMFVVDGRGLGDVWTFVDQGVETLATPLGPVQATQVVREPQRLIDWRVQAWLDPRRGWWPVALRMTVPRSGAVFELQLVAEPVPLEKPP